MKYLSFLFIPILAFSFELEFKKSFSHELPHDVLSTKISITITDDTEAEVSQRLDVFNQKIKSFDKVEKEFGSFSISPEYKHYKINPKINGYKGILSYKINSHKAKHMNDFIVTITKLKQNRDTTVKVSSLAWSVKEDTYNVAMDLLRLKAIDWINRYIRNLSKDVDGECSIKKIIINNKSDLVMKQKTLYASVDSSRESIPVPKAELEKITINPTYFVECK